MFIKVVSAWEDESLNVTRLAEVHRPSLVGGRRTPRRRSNESARWSTVGLVNDLACGALAYSCVWRPSSARAVQWRLHDPFEVVGLEQWLIVEVRHRGRWSGSVGEQESGRE